MGGKHVWRPMGEDGPVGGRRWQKRNNFGFFEREKTILAWGAKMYRERTAKTVNFYNYSYFV